MIDIRNRLVHGGVWLAIIAVGNVLLTLSFNGLLTRVLDPEDVGHYFIAASVSMMVAVFVLLGMDNSIVRLISSSLAQKDYFRATSYFRSVIVLFFCSAAVAAAGYAVFDLFISARAGWKPSWSFELVLIIGFWAFALGLRNLFAAIFRGLHEIALASLFSGMASSVLSVSLLLILFLLGGKYEFLEVASGVLICVLIASISSLAILMRHTRSLKAGGELRLKETLKTSIPLVFATAGFLVMRDTHLWIVGSRSTAEQVALLGAVIYLMQVITVPLSLMNSLIQPSVAHLYSIDNIVRLQTLLRGSAMVVLLCALVGCGVLLCFGDTLLGLIYGEAYEQAAVGLYIIIIGQMINVGVGSPGVLLTMAGFERVVMCFSLIASVFGITTSYLLSLPMGQVGGAIGVAVTFGTYNLLMWLYCLKKLKIPTHASLREAVSLLHELGRYVYERAGRGGIWVVAQKLLAVLKIGSDTEKKL